MIDGLKPYPAYKNSGVPWLPQIPSTWEMRRNGRLFGVRKETGFPDLPILEVSLRTGVRVRDFDGSQRKQMMSDRGKYQRACKGDIAYNMMRMWQGAVGVAPVDGLISPAYVVAQPYPETEADYYAHVFRTADYMREVDNYSRGIVKDRNRLYWDGFKRIPSPFPPPDEQRAIVRFLDHADRLIRRYIRAKMKLIALLNEQKQAIIHQAVTRGHDPNVRLKPSDIEWLGDVPEHWELCRLRNVVSGVTSGSRGWSSFAADEGPLFIRIANLRRVSLDLRFDDVVRLRLPDTAEMDRTRIAPGDLLVSITAYIGSFAVAPSDLGEAYVSQHVARCPLRDDRHNPHWLGYVLLSEVGQTHGRLSLYGGTKDGLSLDDVKNYPILLPPRAEQDAIVEHLNRSLTSTEEAIGAAEREIALIREYYIRLIADIVTGKLDVRDAAARLPEATEGPDAAEDTEDLAGLDEDLEGEDLEDAVAGAEV